MCLAGNAAGLNRLRICDLLRCLATEWHSSRPLPGSASSKRSCPCLFCVKNAKDSYRAFLSAPIVVAVVLWFDSRLKKAAPRMIGGKRAGERRLFGSGKRVVEVLLDGPLADLSDLGVVDLDLIERIRPSWGE